MSDHDRDDDPVGNGRLRSALSVLRNSRREENDIDDVQVRSLLGDIQYYNNYFIIIMIIIIIIFYLLSGTGIQH